MVTAHYNTRMNDDTLSLPMRPPTAFPIGTNGNGIKQMHMAGFCAARIGPVILAIAGLLAGGLPASAPAATEAHVPTSRRPLAVEVVSPLEIGNVTTDGILVGVVVLDPRTGQKTARGGAIDLSGYHSPAIFRVIGEPNARFVITLPHRVEMSYEGESAGSVVLTEFRSDPSRLGMLNANGEAIIRVGATLKLPPATDRSLVRGDFSIFVDYEG